MSIWQQHEGAAHMMLWLLFKSKMGKEQRITVPTLMRIAYGEEKLGLATQKRESPPYSQHIRHLVISFGTRLAHLTGGQCLFYCWYAH